MVFELVYSSVLASMDDIRCVADIVRRARSFNGANGLTGVLVFDGERFCQLIEGNQQTVLQLAERIANDRRHQQFRILHQDFSGIDRRFAQWSMAYALDSRGEVLESLTSTRGPQVAGLLQQQVGSLVLLP